MIRAVMFAAAIAAPCTSLAAETDYAPGGNNVSVAQAEMTATSPPTTYNRTYDPTSAFDGYWYSAPRAIDGQEDR